MDRQAAIFKALSSTTRLKIIQQLHQHQELCVTDLVAEIRTSQSNISQSLSQMRQAGLVIPRKDCQKMFYRLADDRLFDLVKDVITLDFAHPNQIDEA